ncbi:DUF4231 domain-containing protein [Nakamurella lactea]|uniref:DUF4231 domain-containing protein n=1 Tax=Nakamurella lactea TaxID=459515 RepID=UPI00041367A6|nr:DUF4231 domain-containing protein [Nakamurella lactea]
MTGGGSTAAASASDSAVDDPATHPGPATESAPADPATPAGRSAYDKAVAAVIAEFVQDVADDIEKQQGYMTSRLRRYRVARVVAIVAAGLVPVLATVPEIGKVWLGALGALAVVAESLIQLYRWRDSALAAMQMANAMNVQLDLFRTRTPPYDTETRQSRFSRFVLAITAIRRGAGDAFAGIWAEDRPPSAAPGAELGVHAG